MAISLQCNEVRYAAHDAVLIREIGQQVWCSVTIHSENDAHSIAGFIDSIFKGKTYFDLSIGEYCLKNFRVSGFKNQGAQVKIQAFMECPDYFEHFYRPHWRVLDMSRIDTMLDGSPFANFIKVDTSTRNRLSSFQVAQKKQLLQQGVSDFQILNVLLEQLSHLPGERKWQLSQHISGKWLIYRDFREKLPAFGNCSRNDFYDSYVVEQGKRNHLNMDFPAKRSVLFREELDILHFTNWIELSCPCLTNTDTRVWKITDTVSLSHPNDTNSPILWNSELFCLPNYVEFGPGDNQLYPWWGSGKLVDVEYKDGIPWLKVELPPPFEDGFNVIHALLATPTTGTGGNRGLHLLPETGEDVFVSWSGQLNSPAVAIGNIRNKSPELENQFLALQQDFHLLNDKKMLIQAEQEMEIQANKQLGLKTLDISAILNKGKLEIS